MANAVIASGPTGKWEVRHRHADAVGHGEGIRICTSAQEAVQVMQELAARATTLSVSIAPGMWFRYEQHYGTSRRCHLCQSPYRQMLDQHLLDGHSILCVMWHLRRVNLPTGWTNLLHHWHTHMAMFRDPVFGIPPLSLHTGGVTPRIHLQRPPDAPPWRFTAYPPALRPSQQTLVLVRGIVGAGKSEVARTYGLTHRHLEADHWFLTHDGWFYYDRFAQQRAHAWCLDITRSALACGEAVVVANTFCTNEELLPYVTLAAHVQIPVHLVDIVPPARLDAYPTHRKISRSVVRRQLARWEESTVQTGNWNIPITYEARARVSQRPEVPHLPYVCQPGVCPVVMLGSAEVS